MTQLHISPQTINQFEVRNSIGRVVRTFGDATSAFDWAFAHQGSETRPGPLGWPLEAYAVETVTITRERLIEAALPIPLRGRKLQVVAR